MSPVEFVVVGGASWAIVAVLGASLPGVAYAIGRFRARRRRSYTNLITELPPVPAPKAKPLVDDAAAWFAAWAVDTPLDVIERAYWHREFLAIPEVAADLRDAS